MLTDADDPVSFIEAWIGIMAERAADLAEYRSVVDDYGGVEGGRIAAWAQERVIRMLRTIGEMHEENGDPSSALSSYDAAIAEFQTVLDDYSDIEGGDVAREAQDEIASCYRNKGGVYRGQANYGDAIVSFHLAIAEFTKAITDYPDVTSEDNIAWTRKTIGDCYQDKGDTYGDQGSSADAEDSYNDAITEYNYVITNYPDADGGDPAAEAQLQIDECDTKIADLP